MNLKLVTSVVLCAALPLFGCSSKPISVEYDPTQTSTTDWYPIPADAPSTVEYTEFTVPQNEAFVGEANEVRERSALIVAELKDSLGNSSLRFNRTPSSTWELLDAALQELEVALDDKNRSEYRFELEKIRKPGLYNRIMGIYEEQLSLVLIPQENDTLVIVEGEGDEVPSSPVAENLLQDLFAHFKKGPADR
ncbi:hypothetical protein [Reinekea marinisedimentorum]|uniref:Outer membrane protein assembly factor BamC n=1 Tax=Reinekea marinisedimentorum TaxID=230495 RepID=A0A4R3I4H5_9GAMM|nr:hypothetical protein [Reinekea marinisedimentorum]TCS40796.1 hypothetical protein BCF53_108163 [Reinekea marinisedimentorum]